MIIFPILFGVLLITAATIQIVDNYPMYQYYRLTYRLLEAGAYRFYHREHRNRVIFRPVYATYITEKYKEYDLRNTEIVQHLDAHNKCEFIHLYENRRGPLKILHRPERLEWLDLYSAYWFFKIKRFMDKQGYILDYQWDEYYKIKERKQFKFLRG